MPPDRRGGAVPLPRWFEVGLLAVVAVVVGCGGVGLALADAGGYSLALSLGVGLAVALLLGLLGVRALSGGGAARPGGTRPALAAVALALGSAVWNGWFSGQWLNIDRDPAAYALAARWLSDHGSLQVPFGDSWAFTGVPVTGSSGAVYVDGDHLEFQFNHLLAALLAQVRGIGGDRAMLSANAVLAACALLAVYAVGVRLTRRPWVSLVATTVLALSLPVLYVSRTTFSEAVTMLLVWAGVWLLATAWDRAAFRLGLLGGVALGAAVMARADSLVYLVALPLLAAVAALAGADDDRWRRVVRVSGGAVLGAVVPVLIGTIDLVTRSGGYYGEIASQIRPLQGATVTATSVGLAVVVGARWFPGAAHRLTTWVAARGRRAGQVAGVVVVLVLVFAWSIRPAVDHPVGRRNSTVIALQKLEGLSDQPGRLYAGRSMVWMSWYLGAVVLALAVVGIGLLVLAAARGRPAVLVVLAVAAPGAAFYLYRLSNTPDQLFGVRRFVPGTMPLLVLAAAVVLAAVPRELPDRLRSVRGATAVRRGRPVLVAAVVVAVLAVPVGTAWGVRSFSPRTGSVAMFDDTCAALGPDAAVVFPQRSYGSLSYPQVLRDFCGIPVATTATTLDAAQLRQAAAAWRDRGRTLWVLDSTTSAIIDRFGPAIGVRRLGHADDPTDIVQTLSRRADRYAPWVASVYGAPVPP